jgi:hypothetical protein
MLGSSSVAAQMADSQVGLRSVSKYYTVRSFVTFAVHVMNLFLE